MWKPVPEMDQKVDQPLLFFRLLIFYIKSFNSNYT